MSNEKGQGLGDAGVCRRSTMIDRVVWGRDREGKFTDRLAIDYVIEVAGCTGRVAKPSPIQTTGESLVTARPKAASRFPRRASARMKRPRRRALMQAEGLARGEGERRAERDRRSSPGTFRKPDAHPPAQSRRSRAAEGRSRARGAQRARHDRSCQATPPSRSAARRSPTGSRVRRIRSPRA